MIPGYCQTGALKKNVFEIIQIEPKAQKGRFWNYSVTALGIDLFEHFLLFNWSR